MHNNKILIVDDDRGMCSNILDILGDLGYRVDAAHDGRTALRLAHAQAYDAILLDLRMPDID
jgi:CheY-like chemotaxis protein